MATSYELLNNVILDALLKVNIAEVRPVKRLAFGYGPFDCVGILLS